MKTIGYLRLSKDDENDCESTSITNQRKIITNLIKLLLKQLLASGKEVGLKPLYILISVYAGVKMFGITGVILGPVSLTVLKAVNDEMKKREED